jgi:hypothetical protein
LISRRLRRAGGGSGAARAISDAVMAPAMIESKRRRSKLITRTAKS